MCLSLRPHFCPSVFQHGTTRFPLDGFSWNLIFENFSEIFWENSNFFKIWQEWRVLYVMQTNIHFQSYLAQFFLEREAFQANVIDKIKIPILNSIIYIFLNRAFVKTMWKKCIGAGQSTGDICLRFVYVYAYFSRCDSLIQWPVVFVLTSCHEQQTVWLIGLNCTII